MKNTTSTNLFIKQKHRCRSFWCIRTDNVLSIDRNSDMFCRFRFSASKWRHSCWSYVSWNVRNFDVLNAFRMIIDCRTATAAAAASAPVSYFIGVPRWCVVPEWKLDSVPEKRAKSEVIRQNILVRMMFVPLYSTKEKQWGSSVKAKALPVSSLYSLFIISTVEWSMPSHPSPLFKSETWQLEKNYTTFATGLLCLAITQSVT